MVHVDVKARSRNFSLKWMINPFIDESASIQFIPDYVRKNVFDKELLFYSRKWNYRLPHFSLTLRSVCWCLPQVLRFKSDTCDTAGTTRKWTSECTRRPCDGTAKRQYFGGRTVRYKMGSKKTEEFVREQRLEAACRIQAQPHLHWLLAIYSILLNASSAVT